MSERGTAGPTSAPATASAPPDGTLDVRALPSYAFGSRSLMWWGTLGMISIESTLFALATVAYFYILTRPSAWPPGSGGPEILWGSVNLALVLLSEIPNEWTKRCAERRDLSGIRKGLVVASLVGVAAIGLRALEFTALNVGWDTSAYGSAVWMLLGLHTVHLVTDVYDTVILAVLMFVGPIEGRRYADVSDNSLYWRFVVVSWIFVYAVIYAAPRLLF